MLTPLHYNYHRCWDTRPLHPEAGLYRFMSCRQENRMNFCLGVYGGKSSDRGLLDHEKFRAYFYSESGKTMLELFTVIYKITWCQNPAFSVPCRICFRITEGRNRCRMQQKGCAGVKVCSNADDVAMKE
jgi:hypothetical protein